MYLLVIPSIIYFVLAYFFYYRNKYLSFMAMYAAVYFILMLLMGISMNENFLKIYYSLALFIDAIGIYAVSYILTGNKLFTYSLTGIFLLLGIIGSYATFLSTIHIVREMYFFQIIVPQSLWVYTQYAFFYPGLIIVFFLLLIGIESVDTPYGRKVIIVSILALTFGLILYYSIIDALYALIYLVANILGAGIMLIWEVKERYL